VTTVQADESRLRFASITWPPYAGETISGYGIASYILTQACKRVGLTAEFYFMPWTRAMKETKEGKYDALYNAYYSEQRAQDYAISDGYFQTLLTLCTKSDTPIEYDGTPQSLHPYRLGLVRGYVNTESIDNDDEIIKDEAENDILNLRKLIRGRVDLIAIDKYQALHLVKNNPTIEADVSDIRFIYPILEMKELHVMFSKSKPDWQKNLRLLNRGLREIKADGTLNDIMIRYGFSVPQLED